MTLAQHETTVAISDGQLRELVKWAFYASRYMQVDTGVDLMAREDGRIGAFLTEMEAANADLQGGADAYRDGADAFHERFPEGFKSL